MLPSLRQVLLVGCAFWMGVARPGRAQDVQYWTASYGTRALLLGGIVVGSSEDISTAYYNPGRLALLAKTEVLLSGTGYQYSTLKFANGLGQGKDLTNSSLSAAPAMFAAELPSGFLGRSRLAYSVLTRLTFDGRVEAHGLAPDSSFDASSLRFFSGSFEAQERLTETWFGLTWAYPVNKHIGVGLTEYVAVRSQLMSAGRAAQAIDTSGAVAVAVQSRQFDYFNWRLLTKLGMSAQWQLWSLGITVTTPSLSVLGSGSTGRNFSIVDQGIAPSPVTQIATDFQSDVSATYKTPWSIGFGGARAFGPTRIQVSGEWFAAQAAYHVLASQPFTGQSTGQQLTNDVIQQLNSVFNFGVGLEHHLGPKRALYASYRMDRTPLPDSSMANTSLSHWDLSHVTAGAEFSWLRADLVLGTDVAFGNRVPRVAINVIPGSEPDVPSDARITYRSFMLFFGAKLALGTTP